MKKKRPIFKFQKFSRKQRQIFTWWADNSPVKDAAGIIADGAIRSGKTVSMSLSFVMWAMARYDGQNFIMAGKTISSFKRCLPAAGITGFIIFPGTSRTCWRSAEMERRIIFTYLAARTKVPKTWYRVSRQRGPFLMRLH